jgi:hypothetical protein
VAKRVEYDWIPETVRDVLDETYTREGVEAWWNSRKALPGSGGQTPAEVWRRGDPTQIQAVRDQAESLTGQIAT